MTEKCGLAPERPQEVTGKARPLRSRADVFRWSVALGIVLAFGALLLMLQPLRAPWWIYADADAQYLGSSANLMAGQQTFYLDHPGLPLQDLMATSFEARYLVHKLFAPNTTPHAYAGARMLDLNDSRIFYRGFAVLFYLFGAFAVFWVVGRQLGHWGWALAGGVLWYAAPGLLVMSIQYRPDVLQGALVVLTCYLIVAAAERRDPWRYVLAALLMGFTVTVKMHAAGLLLPLVIALALRPPGAAAARRAVTAARAALSRHRWLVGSVGAIWLVFSVLFNYQRYPFETTAEQRRLVVEIVIALVTYACATLLVLAVRRGGIAGRVLERVFNPFNGALLVAMGIGFLLPALMFVDAGLIALVNVRDGLLGGGINETVAPFHIDWSQFESWPLQPALVVWGLAAVAAVYGAARRELGPVLWSSGGLMLGIMAAARIGWPHYFAPSFLLCIPAALWLCRARGTGGAIAAAVLVLVMTVPLLQHRHVDMAAAQRREQIAAATQSIGQQLLQPGQVVLVKSPPTYPLPDTSYFSLVQSFVQWSPDYPYRFLPSAPEGLMVAGERDLLPRYYIGADALAVTRPQRLALAGQLYSVRPMPQLADPALGIGVLRLVHGPGVDEPIGHPDARYDPWTGYFKDASGSFYTLAGQTVVNPPRRTYIPRLHLWRDAYGDYWDANGRHVRPASK
jgi:hypothetical protein